MNDPAREAAKNLIRGDVERGISIESIRSSSHGTSSPNGQCVQIGGWMPVGVRMWSPDYICVNRDTNGKVVNVAYKLKDIYEEIKKGQMVLL